MRFHFFFFFFFSAVPAWLLAFAAAFKSGSAALV